MKTAVRFNLIDWFNVLRMVYIYAYSYTTISRPLTTISKINTCDTVLVSTVINISVVTSVAITEIFTQSDPPLIKEKSYLVKLS